MLFIELARPVVVPAAVKGSFSHPLRPRFSPHLPGAREHLGEFGWLTNEPSEATAGSRVLRRASGDSAWSAVNAASDRGVAVALVAATATDEAGEPGPSAFHGVRLQLGDTRLRALAPAADGTANKETRFNIAPAIQPLVQSGTVGTLATLSLTLVSSEPARVTVYPLELEYDP